MRIIFFLVFFYSPIKLIACSCGWGERSMTDAFSKYSFIAYVKVIKKTGLEKQDSGLVSTNFSSNQYGKVSIEVIEMII